MCKSLNILAFLVLALLSSACSCLGPEKEPMGELFSMYPAPAIDPDNALVKDTVGAFVLATGAPAASDYDFKRYDLNGDGRREAIVMFKAPYGYWCDMHGCTMLVLKAHDDRFELVNGIQPVREPVYVSQNATNGWNDLVVRVSGRWDEAKDVAMQFDGEAYPPNPATLPASPVEIASLEAAAARLFTQ